MGLPGQPTPRLEAQEANKLITIAAKTRPENKRFMCYVVLIAKPVQD